MKRLKMNRDSETCGTIIHVIGTTEKRKSWCRKKHMKK